MTPPDTLNAFNPLKTPETKRDGALTGAASVFCLPFLEPPKFLASARWAPYVWVIDLPRSEDIRRLDRTADRDSSLFWNIPEFLTGTLNVAQNIL